MKFCHQSVTMKIVIATLLCASLTLVTSENSISPTRSRLSGKMLKSMRDKFLPPSSFSNQENNEWIKLLAIVVIDEEGVIQCGGSIIFPLMIAIPTGCWPNTFPPYSAMLRHRSAETRATHYDLTRIVETILPAGEIDIVQISKGIVFGDDSVNIAFIQELSEKKFEQAEMKEPAYGVEMIEDQDWKPELKKYLNLGVEKDFIGLPVEDNEKKPAYPGEPLYQNNKLIGLYMTEFSGDTCRRYHRYSRVPKISWTSAYPNEVRG